MLIDPAWKATQSNLLTRQRSTPALPGART
jgi:hypothetical protein